MNPAQALPFLACVIAAASFGTLPLFARTLTDLGLAPPAIAFFRFAFAAFVLAPLVIRVPVRTLLPAVVGGAAVGLGWIGYVEALKTMTVAEVGVLFMTFPVFAILFGAVFFDERVTAKGLMGAGLILAAALLVAPIGGAPGSGRAVLFALAAPAGYGLLLNIIAHRLEPLPPLAAVGAVAMGSVVAIAPLVVILPQANFLPGGGEVVLWLTLFGVLTALLPQFLLVVFSPKVGAVPTAMAASVELPSTLAVGWIALGEALGPAEFVATGLIVLAVVLGASVAGDRKKSGG